MNINKYSGYLKLILLAVISVIVIFIKELWLISVVFTISIVYIVLLCRKDQQFWLRLRTIRFVFGLVFSFNLLFLYRLGFWDRLEYAALSAFKIATLSSLLFLFNTFISTSELIRIFGFLPNSLKLMATIVLGLLPVYSE